MKIAIYIALFICCLLPDLCRAEEDGERTIEGHPGWTLELIKPEPSEDGAPNYRTAYFVLKPPDKRPAASVTSRIAQELRGGEIGPEAAYEGGSADKAPEHAQSGGIASSGMSGFPGGGKSPGVSGVSTSGSHMPASLGQNSNASTTPGATAPTPLTGASSNSGSSSSPNSTDASSSSAISIKVDNTKGGAIQSSSGVVVAPPPCAPTTVEGCAIGSGGAGTCSSGFTGACSYTCNNGAWAKAQNTCTAQIKACSSVEDCMRVAGVQYNLIGNTQGFIDSNAGYICQKLGKSSVASAATTKVTTENRNGIKGYMVSLCAKGGGCQDKYYFAVASYNGLEQGFDGDFMHASAVSSVECR